MRQSCDGGPIALMDGKGQATSSPMRSLGVMGMGMGMGMVDGLAFFSLKGPSSTLSEGARKDPERPQREPGETPERPPSDPGET